MGWFITTVCTALGKPTRRAVILQIRYVYDWILTFEVDICLIILNNNFEIVLPVILLLDRCDCITIRINPPY